MDRMHIAAIKCCHLALLQDWRDVASTSAGAGADGSEGAAFVSTATLLRALERRIASTDSSSDDITGRTDHASMHHICAAIADWDKHISTNACDDANPSDELPNALQANAGRRAAAFLESEGLVRIHGAGFEDSRAGTDSRRAAYLLAVHAVTMLRSLAHAPFHAMLPLLRHVDATKCENTHGFTAEAVAIRQHSLRKALRRWGLSDPAETLALEAAEWLNIVTSLLPASVRAGRSTADGGSDVAAPGSATRPDASIVSRLTTLLWAAGARDSSEWGAARELWIWGDSAPVEAVLPRGSDLLDPDARLGYLHTLLAGSVSSRSCGAGGNTAQRTDGLPPPAASLAASAASALASLMATTVSTARADHSRCARTAIAVPEGNDVLSAVCVVARVLALQDLLTVWTNRYPAPTALSTPQASVAVSVLFRALLDALSFSLHRARCNVTQTGSLPAPPPPAPAADRYTIRDAPACARIAAGVLCKGILTLVQRACIGLPSAPAGVALHSQSEVPGLGLDTADFPPAATLVAPWVHTDSGRFQLSNSSGSGAAGSDDDADNLAGHSVDAETIETAAADLLSLLVRPHDSTVRNRGSAAHLPPSSHSQSWVEPLLSALEDLHTPCWQQVAAGGGMPGACLRNTPETRSALALARLLTHTLCGVRLLVAGEPGQALELSALHAFPGAAHPQLRSAGQLAMHWCRLPAVAAIVPVGRALSPALATQLLQHGFSLELHCIAEPLLPAESALLDWLRESGVSVPSDDISSSATEWEAAITAAESLEAGDRVGDDPGRRSGSITKGLSRLTQLLQQHSCDDRWVIELATHASNQRGDDGLLARLSAFLIAREGTSFSELCAAMCTSACVITSFSRRSQTPAHVFLPPAVRTAAALLLRRPRGTLSDLGESAAGDGCAPLPGQVDQIPRAKADHLLHSWACCCLVRAWLHDRLRAALAAELPHQELLTGLSRCDSFLAMCQDAHSTLTALLGSAHVPFPDPVHDERALDFAAGDSSLQLRPATHTPDRNRHAASHAVVAPALMLAGLARASVATLSALAGGRAVGGDDAPEAASSPSVAPSTDAAGMRVAAPFVVSSILSKAAGVFSSAAAGVKAAGDHLLAAAAHSAAPADSLAWHSTGTASSHSLAQQSTEVATALGEVTIAARSLTARSAGRVSSEVSDKSSLSSGAFDTTGFRAEAAGTSAALQEQSGSSRASPTLAVRLGCETRHDTSCDSWHLWPAASPERAVAVAASRSPALGLLSPPARLQHQTVGPKIAQARNSAADEIASQDSEIGSALAPSTSASPDIATLERDRAAASTLPNVQPSGEIYGHSAISLASQCPSGAVPRGTPPTLASGGSTPIRPAPRSSPLRRMPACVHPESSSSADSVQQGGGASPLLAEVLQPESPGGYRSPRDPHGSVVLGDAAHKQGSDRCAEEPAAQLPTADAAREVLYAPATSDILVGAKLAGMPLHSLSEWPLFGAGGLATHVEEPSTAPVPALSPSLVSGAPAVLSPGPESHRLGGQLALPGHSIRTCEGMAALSSQQAAGRASWSDTPNAAACVLSHAPCSPAQIAWSGDNAVPAADGFEASTTDELLRFAAAAHCRQAVDLVSKSGFPQPNCDPSPGVNLSAALAPLGMAESPTWSDDDLWEVAASLAGAGLSEDMRPLAELHAPPDESLEALAAVFAVEEGEEPVFELAQPEAPAPERTVTPACDVDEDAPHLPAEADPAAVAAALRLSIDALALDGWGVPAGAADAAPSTSRIMRSPTVQLPASVALGRCVSVGQPTHAVSRVSPGKSPALAAARSKATLAPVAPHAAPCVAGGVLARSCCEVRARCHASCALNPATHSVSSCGGVLPAPQFARSFRVSGCAAHDLSGGLCTHGASTGAHEARAPEDCADTTPGTRTTHGRLAECPNSSAVPASARFGAYAPEAHAEAGTRKGSSPEPEVLRSLPCEAQDRSLLEMHTMAPALAAAPAAHTVAPSSAPGQPGASHSEAPHLEWDDAEFPKVDDLLMLLRTRPRSS